MDDLKNLVIQTLEEEGTLGALRAQLRSRVFKAIEQKAEPAAKQAAGFQWQNPAAQKVHESEESRLMAHMIKEYLDFYRMDYTLSVYTPEAALQNEQAQSREEMARKAGLKGGPSGQEPLLVQMMKQFRMSQQQQPSQQQVYQQQQQEFGGAARKPAEESKKQQQQQNVNKNTFYNNKPQQQEDNDDINEEIVEDIDDDNNNNGASGRIGGLNQADLEGIAASASLGIDQSIDTLRLEEYDYIEEVKFY